MSSSIDPVDIHPMPPLKDSYVFHSPLPDDFTPNGEQDGWLMGIDEAGRGPVLGPMVYAAAYCPLSFKPTLEEIGFDDSKALSAEVRQKLWDSFKEHAPLCYSAANLSPQGISANMLRRVPVNLNTQAEDATIGLIREALDRGVNVKECFVDALGPAPKWQAKLSSIFPTIAFTVCPKADSLFKIVGAASIIAKVTRDTYVHNWEDPEDFKDGVLVAKKDGEEVVIRGSGYPSDPKTQAFLRNNLDPVFGYKGMIRFSWATVKVLLEKQGVECKWQVFKYLLVVSLTSLRVDDTTQPSASSWFGADADNGRPKVWRDVGISGVGEL
ncbi:ribonuclease HII [Cryptococcus wingfieldii CBS 7118]|uniref:Ribonuclease n=1 Tax=Cryptococcus wingfieldii CBS 7118 TaxID=1295528 RepID=A0A1E3J3L4_9TREE|nr:ribonuclease HII [Cryptococcus wingfieldii CBS 7118]ODN94706.1 ribonuclease HII [Cryptococcus wingfieldii CBS 7118]